MDSSKPGECPMRRVILSALLCAASPMQGISPEQVLGSEVVKPSAPLEAPLPTGLPQTAPSTPVPEISLKTAKKEKTLAVSFLGGPGVRTYNLSSSGLNAYFPTALGYQLGLEVQRELSETSHLALAFDYFSSQFSNITSVTPSTFRITAWNTSADYSILLSGGLRPWWLDLGYQMNKRNGANGSPVTLMTDLWFHGPRVGFKYLGPTLFGAMGLNFSSHLMVPWFFQEDIQTTGFFKFGLSSSTALDLRYELRETATLTVGIRLNVDYRNYFGTGTRGAVNGKEFEWVLTFPVSFQIRF